MAIDCWVRNKHLPNIYYPVDHRSTILISSPQTDLPEGSEVVGEVWVEDGQLQQRPYDESVFIGAVHDD